MDRDEMSRSEVRRDCGDSVLGQRRRACQFGYVGQSHGSHLAAIGVED